LYARERRIRQKLGNIRAKVMPSSNRSQITTPKARRDRSMFLITLQYPWSRFPRNVPQGQERLDKIAMAEASWLRNQSKRPLQSGIAGPVWGCPKRPRQVIQGSSRLHRRSEKCVPSMSLAFATILAGGNLTVAVRMNVIEERRSLCHCSAAWVVSAALSALLD